MRAMVSHVNPDESVGFALTRLQQALRTRMDATLAAHGLTTPQYAVLALLAERPGISNAELARLSFVAAPTMLRILDVLHREGLIDRAAPAPEQRTRRTAQTTLGRRRLTAATAAVQSYEDLLRGEAGPEHLGTVLAWLRGCAEKLGGL